MNKKVKIGFMVLLAIFVLGSLVGPKKNTSATMGANDISTKYSLPLEIRGIMDRACMDCHSNNTTYPWYSNILPVNWFLYNHVYGGKKHLDFSEFASYPAKKAAHKLEEMIEMIDKGEMPLSNYVMLHKEADLSSAEKALLKAWALNTKKLIEAE